MRDEYKLHYNFVASYTKFSKVLYNNGLQVE